MKSMYSNFYMGHVPSNLALNALILPHALGSTTIHLMELRLLGSLTCIIM
jgi:hypothetical protein